MPESIQKKLSRVRPPRVHIEYEVETGGAIEKRSLPLVVGIMADLAKKSEKFTIPMKERKFVEIDRDNFNEVMESIEPRIAYSINHPLKENEKIGVALKFKKIDDFRPENVVKAIPALAELFEARTRLNDLLAKLDGNDALDGLLQRVAKSTEDQETLKAATEPPKAE